MITQIIGGALQLGGALFGALSRRKLAKKQMKMANAINPVRTMYTTSPYAKQNKALAENMMNGRMPGSATAEQGILANQAAVINNANRNATSSADALAIAAASQGAADDASVTLADQEARFGLSGLDRVMASNDALTNEATKEYEDKLDYYRDLRDQKNALMYASMGNKAESNQELGNFGMMAGNALMGVKNGGGGKLDWSSFNLFG